MRHLKSSFISMFLLSFHLTALNNPDFKYFSEVPHDKAHLLDSTTVVQIQFGTGGTGGAGVYTLNLISYGSDSTCTTSSISIGSLGNGHTTSPTNGSTYKLSGTGIYNYFVGQGFSTAQVAAMHYFKLQDGKHTSTSTDCMQLSCTTSDCSYVSGAVATLTLNT